MSQGQSKLNYRHTEKCSPQNVCRKFSYVKWVLANQRSERCFSHVKKKIYVQSESRTMFFTCEKNDTSNQSQRCASFAPKFPPFIGACSLQRPRFASASQTVNEKSFSRRVFLVQKWKTSRTSEWNSFMYFSVDEENCREPAKQQRKGKNRRRRKLKLCFLSELLCLLSCSI